MLCECVCLCTWCSYGEVRKRISDKYAEIEYQLINEFIDAQMTLDTKRMKMYARALIPFSYVSYQMHVHTCGYQHNLQLLVITIMYIV